MTPTAAIPSTATQPASAMSPQRKLVARFIPVLGLIGGPLVFAANVAGMFGVPRHDLGVCVVPVFAWEVCLAIFLITKGYRPTAVTPIVPSDERQPQLTPARAPLSLPPGLTPTPVPPPGPVSSPAARYGFVQVPGSESDRPAPGRAEIGSGHAAGTAAR